MAMAVALAAGLAMAAPASAKFGFLERWGHLGSAGGVEAFDLPEGIAASPSGDIYVADRNNKRVTRFDSAGHEVTSWDGPGPDKFTTPVAVSVDGQGRVYVLDRPLGEIQRYSADGVFQRKWAAPGSNASQLNGAYDLSVLGNSDVYAADTGNQRIMQFDQDGNFVRTWGRGVHDGSDANEVCTSFTLPCQAGIASSRGGAYNQPQGVGLGALGSAPDALFVAERNNHRVSRVNQPVRTGFNFGFGVEDGNPSPQVCSGGCMAGVPGDKTGQFFQPTDVAVDTSGFPQQVYVLDSGNNRIAISGVDGSPIGALAPPPGPPKTLSGYIAVDCRGTVYATAAHEVIAYGQSSEPVKGNLLENPGADQGRGKCDDSGSSPLAANLPGWTTPRAGMEAVHYGAAGGFPGASFGDSIDGGVSFFAGGRQPTGDSTTASQTVSVAARAKKIDAGLVSARLSADLGGYADDPDDMTVTALTQRKNGVGPGLAVQIGPVTAADRAGATRLYPRTSVFKLPRGTRSVLVSLEATRRSGGAYIDGYADNLSLTLHDLPRVLKLELSPSSFRAKGPGVKQAGTKVTYKLSGNANVKFTVARGHDGRRQGGKCRKPSPQNSGGKRCTRYTKLSGSFRDSGNKGENQLHFSGRLNGKALPAGNYRLTATPRDPFDNAGGPRRATFRIVK
jgi:hypothetical protein